MTVKSMIAPARDSATIMLVRDKPADDGIEVFMLQRHRNADFGGAWVFPGGLAADADFALQLEPYCAGISDAEASNTLNIESGGLALWVAAIRECFEESGYLLARDFSGQLCQPAATDHCDRFEDYRRALADGSLTLLEVCEAESLTLTCDDIAYVSFWTTPEVLPRRYATRFFVAAVPDGQDGVADGRETVRSRWVCPVAAMQSEMQRELKLHPPTVENLRWLSNHTSVEAVMATAEAIDPSTIQEVLPVIRQDGERVRIELPDTRR
ncbi:MAG: NUDIX hydrolase [Pseudomonadota bacterium]|mgnify:CR=1 FL=1